MGKWEMVKLNELCQINIGKTPSRDEMLFWENGIYKWLSISDMQSKNLSNTKEKITSVAVKQCNMKLIPANTVIMSFKLSVGKVGITVEDMYSNEAIANFPIINLKILDTNYLYCALQTLKFENMDRAAKGLTLNKAKLNQIEIPLPPLEVQKKIAQTFDTASKIITLRKKQLAELDNLIKATFYDMFGDPVVNEKGWDKSLLSTLGVLKNGLNFSSLDSGVSIHCLGVGDFKKYYKIQNTSLLPKISLNKMPTADYLLQDRDIVFVRSNGNKALVGRSVLVYPGDISATFSGFCIRFRSTTKELLETYLIQVLHNTSLKNQLLSNGRGANITNLNQQMLSEIEIPIPPINLQKQFSRIVTKIEEQKKLIQKSIDESQYLFDSLMNEYF